MTAYYDDGQRHSCAGFPEGHECPVLVAADRIWCWGCIENRQRAIHAGMPDSGFSRIGVVVEDFDAMKLACACGGDPTAAHHACSLLHLQWEWRNQHLIEPATGRWRKAQIVDRAPGELMEEYGK